MATQMRVRWWVSVLCVASAAMAADDFPSVSAPQLEDRDRALVQELQRIHTLQPEQLVNVVATAARHHPLSPSLSLLLAIAHAETSGDVLDISEAGAVGLAQATPSALREEAIAGPMYVTRDYLDGARDYYLKKSLHDVEVIADYVVEEPTQQSFDEARGLLQSAMRLRREGIDDLDLLAEWADDDFFTSIARSDARNLELLIELQHALQQNDVSTLSWLRDHAHREYRAAIARQQFFWKRYQHDLATRRDALLEERFQRQARIVRKESGYAAGELLGDELDVRFSPVKMADFLVRHLARKATLAESLAPTPQQQEEFTAALYNGGTHNVKRMLAGLINYLPETENYMRKVPATRRRLDEAIAASR